MEMALCRGYHHTGADPGFLKGGGPGADTGFFTSTPLGHCPRDVIRPQKN